MHAVFFIALSLFLPGCNNHSSPPPHTKVQEISGRDQGIADERSPIYRAKVPLGWIRRDSEDSIADTTKALCTFIIRDARDQEIRITIHNFPSNYQEERIPPSAQVHRWKQQFTQLNPADFQIKPYAHGGFAGLAFEAEGEIAENPIAMLGWAMQIAPAHYSSLSVKRQLSLNNDEAQQYKQMQSDYTIKATGPRELMRQHKVEIASFADSFELIEEIPSAS